MGQNLAQALEINLAIANLQPFTIQASRITEMQVRRKRRNSFSKVIEVDAKVIAGQARMGNVETHPQTQITTPGYDLVNLDENVLVTLTAKVPREWRHGLRDQFHTLHVELTQTLREAFVVTADG